MSEFTEGVCEDGAAILKDGQPLSISEILSLLNLQEKMVRTQITMQHTIDALRDQIVKPLCAHRFKLSFNKVGNCTSLGNFAEELDGQWVWLIDATDGMNDPLFTAPLSPTTTLNDQERAPRTGDAA
jgi:hypothetical protein